MSAPTAKCQGCNDTGVMGIQALAGGPTEPIVCGCGVVPTQCPTCHGGELVGLDGSPVECDTCFGLGVLS